jgi:hypothetical protein
MDGCRYHGISLVCRGWRHFFGAGTLTSPRSEARRHPGHRRVGAKSGFPLLDQIRAPRLISSTFGHRGSAVEAEFGPLAYCSKTIVVCARSQMVCIKWINLNFAKRGRKFAGNRN